MNSVDNALLDGVASEVSDEILSTMNAARQAARDMIKGLGKDDQISFASVQDLLEKEADVLTNLDSTMLIEIQWAVRFGVDAMRRSLRMRISSCLPTKEKRCTLGQACLDLKSQRSQGTLIPPLWKVLVCIVRLRVLLSR